MTLLRDLQGHLILESPAVLLHGLFQLVELLRTGEITWIRWILLQNCWMNESIWIYQPSTSRVVWLFDRSGVFFKNAPLILSTFKRLNILPSGTTYLIVIGCHRELAWKSSGAPDLPCPPLILQQWPRKILPRNIGKSAQQWKSLAAFSGSETGIPMIDHIDHHLNLATNSGMHSPCSIFFVYIIGISTIQWVYIYIWYYRSILYYTILYYIMLCHIVLLQIIGIVWYS